MAPAQPLIARSLSSSNAVTTTQLFADLQKRMTRAIRHLRFLPARQLTARQNSGSSDGQVGTIIPTTYNTQSSLSPGAVAGIVIGVVFGILAFIILIAWAQQLNSGVEPSVDERIEVRDRALSPSSRGHSRRRRRRSSRRDYEVAEVRAVRSVSPRRSSGRRTRIVEERIVEERRPNRSRASSVVVPMEQVYVDRRPRRSTEEVVVLEDSDFSSEPRNKRKSKRRSRDY